ncbi:MAG: SIS domain-containing protein [Clostridia bacterium]|nr:SIS domain-containing protein [Clostridia bacterium]
MYEAGEKDERVLCHYERLFKRYPELECVRRSLMDAYVMIRDSFSEGGKLLLCGNGGSCADCDHIAGELMKGFYLKRPLGEDGVLSHLQGALPAIALTEHSALSTAFMNDCESAYVYAQQLVGYGRRGDVLIAISTSGNAVNVINACEAAKRLGVKTVALSGGSGGRLKAACDCAIIAPASTPADVQEYHLPIYHTLCAMLEAHYYKE